MNLTKEQIESNVDAFKAWMNGEPVEFQTKIERQWELISDPTWYKDYCYRRKPKPAVRKWNKPDDVPGPVCWLSPNGIASFGIIDFITPNGISVGGQNILREWCDLDDYSYSTDRKTWRPCEVVEEVK